MAVTHGITVLLILCLCSGIINSQGSNIDVDGKIISTTRVTRASTAAVTVPGTTPLKRITTTVPIISRISTTRPQFATTPKFTTRQTPKTTKGVTITTTFKPRIITTKINNGGALLTTTTTAGSRVPPDTNIPDGASGVVPSLSLLLMLSVIALCLYWS